ncbi:MAG TPA: SNF2-related protein [Candidatus Marinimicrobia bacterium]|nr:SNF2-related protein [Candidatus Neomarinimicrobiota bacterium]HQK12052.1 SNF2-related protein [Candidatus Neomarinimicrobiota bacterium]
MFQSGRRVRLKLNPSRMGVTTEKTMERAGRLRQQVVFPDGCSFELISTLEEVSEEYDDPIDLLTNGRIGRVSDLRGNLTYIRLNGRLANLIYSMDTTNTDFYPFQFKPVLNFIDSPTGGLLVADEVGLGKTIEAGLIWTELRSRFEARRLMVLCPAVLQEKWQFELLDKFGIDTQILNSRDTLRSFKEYRSGNRLDFAIIGSMQGLRPHKGWDKDNSEANDYASLLCRFIKENEFDEPLIDLLIIDEAHYLRNPESMTSKLGNVISNASDYKVFLSATPIHIKSHDLYQLLNILDADTFYRPAVFDEILKANEPLIKARELLLNYNRKKDVTENVFSEIKELLISATKHPYLSENRQLAYLIDSFSSEMYLSEKDKRAEFAERLERINLLSHVVNRTRKRDVKEFRVIREAVPERVEMTAAEAEFYYKVTNLIREYARKNLSNEGFLTVMPQRQMSSSMPAALESWINRIEPELEQLDEDTGSSENYTGEIGPLTKILVEQASHLGDLETLYNDDSKYKRLKHILTNHLRKHPKDKIVLFAYFKSTLKYLERRLSLDGIKCTTLMGGTSYSKYDVIEKFAKPSGPNVLLSSEVASEGVDLQFAYILINYDLPWNPMKVEQRIGRIDRLGQESKKIFIWNLFYNGTIDDRIYNRLYARLKIFEHSLGNLEAVIGEKIQKLTWDLLSQPLTHEEEEEMIIQTENAISNLHVTEERLENEASNLIAHGEYILHQVRAAQELQRTISSRDLWIFVRDFFDQEYEGCEFIQQNANELLFDIKLSKDAKYDLDMYIQRKKLFGQTKLSNTGQQKVRCLFYNKTIRNTNPNQEIINQFHPLIRFIADKIKLLGKKYYSPVGVQIDQSNIGNFKKGIYAFAIQLWSLGGIRDIEKLNYEISCISDETNEFSPEQAEKLIVSAALEGNDWLTIEQEIEIQKAVRLVNTCIEKSENKYIKYVHNVQNENNDRADIQEKAVISHQKRQLEILNELMKKHQENNRLSLVEATKGKIEKLNSRVEWRLRTIGEQRKLISNNQDVCIGLIKVT